MARTKARKAGARKAAVRTSVRRPAVRARRGAPAQRDSGLPIVPILVVAAILAVGYLAMHHTPAVSAPAAKSAESKPATKTADAKSAPKPPATPPAAPQPAKVAAPVPAPAPKPLAATPVPAQPAPKPVAVPPAPVPKPVAVAPAPKPVAPAPAPKPPAPAPVAAPVPAPAPAPVPAPAAAPAPKPVAAVQPAGLPAGSISLADAKALFDTGKAVFVDARLSNGYVFGHVPGSVNLPSSSFEAAFALKGAALSHDLKLVVYCADAHGPEAEAAYLDLTRRGFANAVKMPEGWNGWSAAGYPKERGFGTAH